MSSPSDNERMGIIPTLAANVVALSDVRARAQAEADALENLKALARALARQAALEDHNAALRSRT